MKKDFPTLLLEAEGAFDKRFPLTIFPQRDHVPGQIKSFLRETVLSILSEAERATGVNVLVNTREEGNSDWFYGYGFNSALSQVKSLWREWRGNLK